VDVTDSVLNPESQRTEINSDSIEAGLMTLVIKGKDEYFQSNAGRRSVTVELEDVITIHIMNPDGIDTRVEELITQDQADNTNTSGLDTDGYSLNGAFNLAIDRSAQRAHLEPSSDLLDICPFNPTRPAGNVPVTETCVTRRDVRYRGYPFRAGRFSTALEICPGTGTTCAEGDSKAFFKSVFGSNDYSEDLALGHTGAIFANYSLNGRSRRAYMINPGYEWTPTQTQGASIFSVSQKLYMFALITLDEGVSEATGELAPASNYPSRRRMLLSSVDDALKDGQSGLGGASFEFKTSPTQMLATAFDVPAARVATYTVNMQMSKNQDCLEDYTLAEQIRATLADMAYDAASPHQTVQILTMKVNKDPSVSCRRRNVGVGGWSASTAEVTMAVVFEKGGQSTFSIPKMEANAGINSVKKLDVSPQINDDADGTYVPPKDDESSGGMNVALIGGIAGGACALVMLLVGGVIFMKSRSDTAQPVTAVQTINVEDLKSQLAGEV
jgi:hypothetical protein